jgi:hypothetical protein
MKLIITHDQAAQICKLYKSSPDYGHFCSSTEWTIEKHDVEFNGVYDNYYYLKGEPEKITWFLLKL